MQPSVKEIMIGARDSPLSQAQVQEVQAELKLFYPDVHLHPLFLKTQGDLDKKTSLREMEKSDFFTRELDEKLIRGELRAAVHSAKDLPDPLPKGLVIAALTKGVDSSDALVMREGKMPSNPKIGTSSHRREESVRQLLRMCTFEDVRGTIEERLQLLNKGMIDGLVVAEAALIRLKLTTLNRIRLEGETVAGQGRLAIVIREDDTEMKELFKVLNETHPLSRS